MAVYLSKMAATMVGPIDWLVFKCLIFACRSKWLLKDRWMKAAQFFAVALFTAKRAIRRRIINNLLRFIIPVDLKCDIFKFFVKLFDNIDRFFKIRIVHFTPLHKQ